MFCDLGTNFFEIRRRYYCTAFFPYEYAPQRAVVASFVPMGIKLAWLWKFIAVELAVNYLLLVNDYCHTKRFVVV